MELPRTTASYDAGSPTSAGGSTSTTVPAGRPARREPAMRAATSAVDPCRLAALTRIFTAVTRSRLVVRRFGGRSPVGGLLGALADAAQHAPAHDEADGGQRLGHDPWTPPGGG